MKIEVGSSTVNGTGNHTVVLNDDTIDIKSLEVWLGKSSAVDSNFALGMTDGARQRCVSTFNDGTVKNTATSTTKILIHYRNSSGLDLYVEGSATDIATTGEFTINFSVLDTSTQFFYRVIGE